MWYRSRLERSHTVLRHLIFCISEATYIAYYTNTFPKYENKETSKTIRHLNDPIILGMSTRDRDINRLKDAVYLFDLGVSCRTNNSGHSSIEPAEVPFIQDQAQPW